MPANLPPQARAKWKKVEEARTKEEKLQALIEFVSSVPKHKGTEKLLMQVRRQIARLREELEQEQRRRRSLGRGPSFFVEKEGDMQLVLLGFANAGKSTLLSALTGVACSCSDVPYETAQPQPGMMVWDGGVSVQLVDTPPLAPSQGSPRNSLILSLAYNADGLVIVVDATQDALAQLELIETMLRAKGVTIREERRKVVIERRRSGGVSVLGGRLKASDVAELLREYGIYHALVQLADDATLDDVEAAILELTAYKPALVIVTKADLNPEGASRVKGGAGHLKVLEFALGSSDPAALRDEIGEYFFRRLNLIRVYTRKDGVVSERPLVLKRGARVADVAERVHSRLVKEFRYALVWNERRLKISPARVGIDFVLDDMDVVEIVA